MFKKKVFCDVHLDQEIFRKLCFIRAVYAKEHAGEVVSITSLVYAAVDYMYDVVMKYCEDGDK